MPLCHYAVRRCYASNLRKRLQDFNASWHNEGSKVNEIGVCSARYLPRKSHLWVTQIFSFHISLTKWEMIFSVTRHFQSASGVGGEIWCSKFPHVSPRKWSSSLAPAYQRWLPPRTWSLFCWSSYSILLVFSHGLARFMQKQFVSRPFKPWCSAFETLLQLLLTIWYSC